MAFATLHDTDAVGGEAQSVGSTIPVDYPTNVSSGDLLILIVAGDNLNRGIASGPTGYSTFVTPDNDIAGATGPIAAYYKIAAGTETGSTTLTQNSSIDTQYCYAHLRFSGWSGTLSDVVASALSETANTLSTSTVDVTATTGAGDNLFLSVFTTHNTGTPTVTYPTNFTGTTLEFNSANEACIAIDQEQDTGATFGSGGTWSYTDAAGTTNVRTFTFVVPPASGGTNVSTTLTAVNGTGAVGTLTATGEVNATATLNAVNGTGAVGTLTANGTSASTATLTAVAATGAVGNITANAVANVSTTLTAVNGTGAVGNIIASSGSITLVTLIAVAATGAVGSMSAVTDSFNFEGIKTRYSRKRVVYVRAKETSAARTVRVT